MLVKITANTKTHDGEYLATVFRENIKKMLVKFLDASGALSESDRARDSEISQILDTMLVESSPPDMLDLISWNWETEEHRLTGGASGTCTIYLKGDVVTDNNLTTCEFNQNGLHLSLLVDIC
jgi:hypothetical protein